MVLLLVLLLTLALAPAAPARVEAIGAGGLEGVRQAGWSRDGKRLAVVRGGVLRVGTRRIAHVPGAPYGRIAWSPAGMRVAFADRRGLWTVLRHGDGRRLVAARGREPSWSPSGRIVFTARGELRITALGGHGTQPLLEGVDGAPDRPAASPHFSPDGRRVLFVADGALHVFAFDGRELRRFSPSGVPDPAEAAFSRDGRRIAFVVRGRGRRDGLYVCRADGTRPRRLVARGGLRAPSWR